MAGCYSATSRVNPHGSGNENFVLDYVVQYDEHGVAKLSSKSFFVGNETSVAESIRQLLMHDSLKK